MTLLFGGLASLVGLYIFVLLGRFFLDLITSINPQFRPRGLLLVVCELVFTLTDPPLNFLRRFIRPVRFGGIALDFAWTILFIGLSALQNILQGMAV